MQTYEKERPDLAPYAARSETSRGRRYPENFKDNRTDFQRDRDRIIHCAAFRRLEYKTQVFVNHERPVALPAEAGDDAHVLEVAQIARGTARAMGLNEELAEAITLAHDLGHTPFGHSGEDLLNELMKDHGGFEHNRQSLRIVEELEERYPNFSGLNLTFETREGIIKHSSFHDQPAISEMKDYLPGGAKRTAHFHVIIMKVDNKRLDLFNQDIDSQIEGLKQQLTQAGFQDEVDVLKKFPPGSFHHQYLSISEEFALHEADVLYVHSDQEAREIISRAVDNLDLTKLTGTLLKYGISEDDVKTLLNNENKEHLINRLIDLWDRKSYCDTETRGRLIPGSWVAADRIKHLQTATKNSQGSYTVLDLFMPEPNAFLEDVPEDITKPMLVEQSQVVAWQATHGQTQYPMPNLANELFMILATGELPQVTFLWGGVGKTPTKKDQTTMIGIRSFSKPIVSQPLAADQAQVGGIDLQQASSNLQIQKNPQCPPLLDFQEAIDQGMFTNGFFPVILNITPINVSHLVGYKEPSF
jgi:hypothetical protein